LGSRIKEKIGPFAIVSVLGLIVVAWTALVNPLFTVIIAYTINGSLTAFALAVAQILLSFAVSTMLFAITYKMIPQAKVHWKDVGLAAISTGIAFTVLNYIFGEYIQTFTVTTIVGAA
jgi:membrane protein